MKQRHVIMGFILLSLFMIGCQGQQGTPDDDDDSYGDDNYGDTKSGDAANGENAEKGRAVFTITDAAADMKSVSELHVTVDSIQAHSKTGGWVTLSKDAKTYDLLELKSEGSQALLIDTTIAEGTYDQLRLDVSNVVVVDDKGKHTTKLPSNEIKMKGNIEVEEDATATATFDFIADESLHVTGNGEYILAPVIQLETRNNAEVVLKNNERVEISGGSVATKAKVGMDVEGNVDVGLKIPAQAKLSIGNGKITSDMKLGLGLGLGGSKESNDSNKSGAKGGLNTNLKIKY